MKFNYNIEPPKGILDYAKRIFDSFDTPYMALDIGVKDYIFYLFEFQFISFGQYTLEKSKFFYCFEDEKWNKVFERPDLEREIATSITRFIKKH